MRSLSQDLAPLSIPRRTLADVLPKLSDQKINRGKGHLDTLTPMAWAAKNAS